MQIELWWLLVIPFMFVVGWISANWEKKQQNEIKDGFSKDYEEIILFLADEKIIEVSPILLSLAKKNPNAYLLQLSLGILYRKNGLIDRAIEVHGSLLSVKDLTKTHRDWIVLELAKDYLEAGLYDRASLSLELLEKTNFHQESLELRFSLAQRLKNWSEAFKFAEELETLTKISFKGVKTHFLCELAEQGDHFARRKVKKLDMHHPRVEKLDSVLNNNHQAEISSKEYKCSECGASFTSHFWKCYVCNSWDTAE